MAVFEIGKRYDFDTVVPTIFGITYKDMLVKAIMRLDVAITMDSSLTSKHEQAYPQLPAGAPKDPGDLMYIQFEDPDGKVVVMATDWISDSSVVLSNRDKYIITLYSATQTEVDAIKDYLNMNGIDEYTISKVT